MRVERQELRGAGRQMAHQLQVFLACDLGVCAEEDVGGDVAPGCGGTLVVEAGIAVERTFVR